MLSPAPNCMIRRAGPGLPQAASTRHVLFTRRPCCKTARSLLEGDISQFLVVVSRVRKCTTRRAGLGLPQATSTPDALFTLRRCYKTARSLLQGDLTQTTVFW